VGRGASEVIPSVVFIGRLRDVRPGYARLETDDRLSVILDYQNGICDELRLVNDETDIYLGRCVFDLMLCVLRPWSSAVGQ
jgi:hypothetical protein